MDDDHPLCLARTCSDPAQTSSRPPTHTLAVLTPLERPETMSPSSPRAIVSPSVLASNFAQLGDEIRRMMKCGAEWVHMGASAPNPLRAAVALLDATSPHPTSLADPERLPATDVMDGHFVPNITMGAPVLASVNKDVKDVFMDCHMMVSDPEKVPRRAKGLFSSLTELRGC